MSAPAPQQLSRGALVGIAVAAVAIVIGAILLLPPPGPTATAPTPSATGSSSPSPTTSPSASPTPSPTASPSPSPAATAAGRYVNSVLGFSVQLPAAWRRTACLSGGAHSQIPEIVGIDTFTSVPVAEESYGDTGGLMGTVSVRVDRNPTALSADAWARSPRMGAAQGQNIVPAMLDGRAGVRIVSGALQTETTIVPVDDLMYMVGFTAPAGDPKIPEMRAIIGSFTFVPRTAAPAATARPARSAEAVADALAAGFAAKDVAALTALMGDCVISGAEQAGFGSHSPERFAAILRQQFAAGTTVVVRPRPIESAPGYGDGPTSAVATTWTDPGQAPMRIDLIIAADGSFHYWRGMVRRQQAP